MVLLNDHNLHGDILKEHLIPQPVFMICILQNTCKPYRLTITSDFLFLSPNLFLEDFILFLLQVPFPIITPVSHAERTDW